MTETSAALKDAAQKEFSTFIADCKTGKTQDSNNNIFDFDDEFAVHEKIRGRQKRKSGPDTVQILAEKYQKTRDQKLWTSIYNQLWHGLVTHCNQVIKNYAMAEDTAAEILLRAYERIDEYNPEISKFSTWVWMMGFRQSLRDNLVESRNPMAISSFAEDADLTTVISKEYKNKLNHDYFGDTFEPDINISEKLYDASVQELYDTSIGAIHNVKSDITRRVLEMKLLENCTIKEIGATLNLTESNVKNHLYKGKREIADQIKKDNPNLYSNYIESKYVISNA